MKRVWSRDLTSSRLATECYMQMTNVSPLSMQKQWTVIFLWSQRRTPGDAIGIERYNRAIPVRSSLPPLVVRFRTAITDSALKEFLEAHDGSLRGAPSKSASPGCGGVLILAF